MNADERQPYRDPLDKVEDIETGLAPPDAAVIVAAERASLERALLVAGKELLSAADAAISSVMCDPLETAVLIVRLTEQVTARQSEAITKLVVDAKVSTRVVADRLKWSPAQVAFACKARRTT